MSRLEDARHERTNPITNPTASLIGTPHESASEMSGLAQSAK
jgi:hypothetical protein